MIDKIHAKLVSFWQFLHNLPGLVAIVLIFGCAFSLLCTLHYFLPKQTNNAILLPNFDPRDQLESLRLITITNQTQTPQEITVAFKSKYTFEKIGYFFIMPKTSGKLPINECGFIQITLNKKEYILNIEDTQFDYFVDIQVNNTVHIYTKLKITPRLQYEI